MTQPLVALHGVDKRYASGTLALAGLDLSIGAGEFVSLVGASGCGKSTVLRLIAGLTEPSAGTICWDAQHGRTRAVKEDASRDLGFVFQEPTLMPWTSVLGNVMLPLQLAGTDRRAARARAEQVLSLVGLGGFAKSFPRELSGGMRMRVSIARALVTNPRVLLMDEPFAALDEITRLKLNDDLLRLWREQGWTVVFVTHSIYESVYLSSRIIVISGQPGRVVDEIAVDAPYPRDPAFRHSPDYARYCGQVQAALGLEHAA